MLLLIRIFSTLEIILKLDAILIKNQIGHPSQSQHFEMSKLVKIPENIHICAYTEIIIMCVCIWLAHKRNTGIFAYYIHLHIDIY